MIVLLGSAWACELPRLVQAELKEATALSYRDPEAGEAQLAGMIERYPECGTLWRGRAATRHARGEDDAAESDLRKAHALGDRDALRALAAHLHQREGAGPLLDQAVLAFPADSELKIFQAMERPPSERPDLLEAALEAHPDDVVVAHILVDALEEAGRPWEAIDRGKTWLAHHEDAQLTERVAVLEAPFRDEERFRPTPGHYGLLEDGTELVVVYSPAKARAALDDRLHGLGWTDVREIPGGLRYRSELPVQPFVDVFDDGQVQVQKRGWIKPNKLQNGQTMIPVISARKLRRKRVRMMEDVAPEVWTWQQALARQTFQDKIDSELPDRLQDLWDDGLPIEGRGIVETLQARRDAMVVHWQTRACTPEGDAVRDVVARFLANVVQASEVALDADALRAVELGAACRGRSLSEPSLAMPIE